MEKRYVMNFDEYDQKIMIRALNDLRTSLIAEERSTDAVDELMVRVYDARRKKLLVSESRADYGHR
jgi:hypothetical protein